MKSLLFTSDSDSSRVDFSVIGEVFYGQGLSLQFVVVVQTVILCKYYHTLWGNYHLVAVMLLKLPNG